MLEVQSFQEHPRACMLIMASMVAAAQVLREAHAVDMKYDEGGDIRPLCGLTFAVKDLYDVAGYHTVAGTPALAGQATIHP